MEAPAILLLPGRINPRRTGKLVLAELRTRSISARLLASLGPRRLASGRSRSFATGWASNIPCRPRLLGAKDPGCRYRGTVGCLRASPFLPTYPDRPPTAQSISERQPNCRIFINKRRICALFEQLWFGTASTDRRACLGNEQISHSPKACPQHSANSQGKAEARSAGGTNSRILLVLQQISQVSQGRDGFFKGFPDFGSLTGALRWAAQAIDHNSILPVSADCSSVPKMPIGGGIFL